MIGGRQRLGKPLGSEQILTGIEQDLHYVDVRVCEEEQSRGGTGMTRVRSKPPPSAAAILTLTCCSEVMSMAVRIDAQAGCFSRSDAMRW